MRSVMEKLSETVRTRRVALRLTQRELADLAGVSERFVRLVEADKESLRLDKVAAVLDVLGLELHAELKSS
ncbi:MAG TPA: type II toxin-antitoxin system Y4mF family antitoxin [Propionibacteriaceae bacterium]